MGDKIYWIAPPESTGVYNLEDVRNLVYRSNMVPLGRVKLVDYSNSNSNYSIDLSSIEREFDTSVMAGCAYSNDIFNSFGIQPYVNATGYFTGCANKKEACTVISDSVDVEDMRGNVMQDLFVVNKPGNLGTSGGPFYYNHVFNPNQYIVAGMACTTNATMTGFAKTDHVLSKYGFTPYF